MRELKISVVMPSFNQAHFIEESIKSVLNQDYKNFELIIVDGLSTDGTKDIIEKYKGHENISYIISEKDNGQADALRKGFSLCSGDILAWLNSDDIYSAGAFSTVMAEFNKDDSIEVVNGVLHVIDKDSAFVDIWPQRRIKNEHWIHTPQCIGQPSTFFKSSLYNKVGKLNAHLRFAMDYDLFFRFAMSNAKFSYVDNHLASFRVHDQSKTMSLPYKFWKEEFEVYYRISGGRLFSGFYYWKFRGIISYIIKGHILKIRRY